MAIPDTATGEKESGEATYSEYRGIKHTAFLYGVQSTASTIIIPTEPITLSLGCVSWPHPVLAGCMAVSYVTRKIMTKKILDVFSLYGQPIRSVNGGSGVMSGLSLAATVTDRKR